MLQTILNDKNENKDEAITEIYKILRPGEPPTLEIAFQIFQNSILLMGYHINITIYIVIIKSNFSDL